MIRKLWFYCKYYTYRLFNMRLTDSFGYFHEDTMLAGVIDEDGDLLISVQVGLTPKGTYPLRKPNEVRIVVKKEALPMIKQWFAHIDTEHNVTFVNNSLVPPTGYMGKEK